MPSHIWSTSKIKSTKCHIILTYFCQYENEKPLCSSISFWALIPIYPIHECTWLTSSRQPLSPFFSLDCLLIKYHIVLNSFLNFPLTCSLNGTLFLFDIPFPAVLSIRSYFFWHAIYLKFERRIDTLFALLCCFQIISSIIEILNI